MGYKLKGNKKHIKCHPNLKLKNVSNFHSPGVILKFHRKAGDSWNPPKTPKM